MFIPSGSYDFPFTLRHHLNNIVNRLALWSANRQIDDTAPPLPSHPVQTGEYRGPATLTAFIQNLHTHNTRILVDAERVASHKSRHMCAVVLRLAVLELRTARGSTLQIRMFNIDPGVEDVHGCGRLRHAVPKLLWRSSSAVEITQMPRRVLLTL